MDWYSDDPRLEQFAPVARSSGFPIDTLLFVFDALHETPYYVGDEPGDVESEPRDCSAGELCRAVPQYARHLFGAESQAVLQEMCIFTSEDLGKVVFAMVDAGLIEARAGDRPEDFIGVCRIADA
jgi:uncharacterized repeat protein (TIGR04138 family)